MKFETLKTGKFVTKKRIIIGATAVVVVLVASLTFYHSFAKYRFTESIPFVRGTINYKMPDLNIMAMYQENSAGTGWNPIDVAPTSGYSLNTTESRCEVNGTKDSSISIEFADGKVNVSNLTKKGTKCYMYFSKIRESALLAKYTKAGARSNYQTLTSDNSGKVYSLDDNDGTSYYFAGAVNNNWVKFAGFYWRIVRFNGDKSVRLIYSGTTAATTGSGTQLSSTSAFNSSYNNNKYVGYRYTDGDAHGTDSPSTIQGVIDTWYKTNIVDKGYSGKVETKGTFCGDRDSYTDYNGTTAGGGTGTTTTYYGAFIRFVKGNSAVSSPTPTLKCKNSSDLYTVNGTKKGNESLTYPVGLITADEVNAAGAIYGTQNKSYYLYTNSAYWTMSPYRCGSSGNYARVFRVFSDGYLYYDGVNSTYGVRPVINLKADTLFATGGDGTASNPYVVS